MTLRRTLLIPLILVLPSGLWVGCQTERPDAADSPAATGPRITHGPILGRLGSDAAAVWVRTDRSSPFTVFFGERKDSLTRSVKGQTQVGDDFSGWVELEPLESSTKYFYRVSITGDSQGRTGVGGSFHTLPVAADVYDSATNPEGLFNIRFEFACGNNQNLNNGSAFGPALPTYSTMLEELVREDEKSRVDFAILNGDWLYEEQRSFQVEQWSEQHGVERLPRELEIMPNLAGVWENYKLYLSRGETLAAWHRSVPSFFTFDDHELVNDVYGSGEVGRQDRRAVFRDIGVTGWYDYLGWSNQLEEAQPVLFGTAELEAGSDVLHDDEAIFQNLDLDDAATLHVHWGTADAGEMNAASDTEGGLPNSGVYEVTEVIGPKDLRIRPAARADGEAPYSIGRRSYWRKTVGNADFFFLDTRTYREMHDLSNRKAPVSMLGRRQKDWLKRDMASSQADFLFVVSSVNFSIPHVGGTGGAKLDVTNKDDAWTVFLGERKELIDYWDSLGKPVFVLTGDLHNSFAIAVTDRVWEFASGPHNSVNHPASSEGDRPPNGPYDSFGRKVDIRWSSYIHSDTPNEFRNRPVYCVVRVNNVFRNPKQQGLDRWVAYPIPQATFQYHDGLTGELLYAESVLAR